MPIADPTPIGRCRRRTRYACPLPVPSFDVHNPAPAPRHPLGSSPVFHGPMPATSFSPPLPNRGIR